MNNARAKTEILKNTLDHQTTPTPYYDPKAQSTSIAPQATANKAFSTRPGQFLVTTDTASSASSAWAGGHAAIVYSGYYTIESFGNRGNENGVRLWSNDWNTRYSHFQLRSVSGTTAQQDTNAAYAAYSFLNKPYNYNFFNINQTNSFYCSQLVWYVFNNKYNINLNDGGAVWPVDLTQSPNAYLVYSQ
ncbi:YiiX/YebB-like N1pC/P60 family cysteine hydrolase [Paenibacillus campi]|uniref:YiiX/YebB-like N1pC/P60 family cysteine hydrolase n=1 Tax=Paenibacillus campi TaxID=3106031 RepID=UPI002AFFDF88|nr:YiiX/YebB-like N1pC/P60 family cysteine hydrolase [Paenibacillus sp. SGZ-1014]